METKDKIRFLRESQGISQEFLANELGISQKTLSRIENGQTDISVNQLKNIAKVLGVSATELFEDNKISIHIENQNGENFYGIQNGTVISLSSKKEDESIEKIMDLIDKLEQEIKRLKNENHTHS